VLLDFLPESLVAEKFTQEDRLDDAAQLVESLIRRVLKITTCKPPEKCIGQEYSVNVQVSFEDGEDGLGAITARFHDAYKMRYGHPTPGAPIEFVNLRVAAFGKLERYTAGFRPAKGDQSPDTGTRDVIFHGQAAPTKFYRRDRLPTGIALAGPHVIEEETATTVVPPGWISRVDALGNIIITRKES
jgi:N-methylhydantoinase A